MFAPLRLIARRHLFERPVRTMITILGVGLGVSVSVAIRTANVDVLRSFEETVSAVAGRATLQVSGGELGLDESVITVLRRHPDVGSATPVLQQGARVEGGPNHGKSFVVMGLDLLEAADLKEFRVRGDGGSEQSLDSLLSSNAMFVGMRLAAEWGVQTGTMLDILIGTRVHRVVIQGIVESGTGLPSVWENLGVMDIAAAQALFGLVGRLDRIDIVTEPGSSISAVEDELRRLLPPSLTVARPSQRNEQVQRMLKAFQLNLTTLSAVGLLVGPLLDASRTAPARALAPGEYEVAQELRTGALAGVGCGGLVLADLLALPGPVGGLPVFGYASAFCLLLGLSCLAPAIVRGAGALIHL